MIKFGILSLFLTFLISGCSIHKLENQEFNTYDLRLQHEDIIRAHKATFNQLEENRLSNTALEIEHNALWYYGVDMNLNKDEIFLIESNKNSYLKFDFGFERFSKFYTKNFFGNFNEDLILRSKFKNFNNLFSHIYLRVTKLNETEYIYFIRNLHNKNIIDVKEYLKIDIDKYIANYFTDKYINKNFYFYMSGNKQEFVTRDNFLPYIYSMYIVYSLLKTNNLEIINDI